MDRRDFLRLAGGATGLFATPFTERSSLAVTGEPTSLFGESKYLNNYNIRWESPSANSSESMPCGGGDIGLNVWVEEGDLLFYLSRSGAFDENNMFPKLGRVRMRLAPNPFTEGAQFRQELKLRDGYVEIQANDGGHKITLQVWVDVHRPVVHVETESSELVTATATYESWRTENRPLKDGERFACYGYSGYPGEVIRYQDEIGFADKKGVRWHHRNRNDKLIFDFTADQQGLESVKDQMWNPQKGLTFGGFMRGEGLEPAGTTTGTYVNTDYQGWKLRSTDARRSHNIEVFLHVDQTETQQEWEQGLEDLIGESKQARPSAREQTLRWWHQFWGRSHIAIQPDQPVPSASAWQVGRNYQLFRYMLGCNAYGEYPTKFNGGLFTYDPVFVNKDYPFSPDHRNWGGGSFTAQNQRMVYWPMLKSGDWDMMAPQFNFYRRPLGNAELRSGYYWGHKGACFTEQIENFALPAASQYAMGWDRPEGYQQGIQYNNWIEYEWDTVLEICLMILRGRRYYGQDISEYMPLIESCLTFFDEHYQHVSSMRTTKALDGDGHLVLYPGTACETYKMAYNSTTTIAGLKTVLSEVIDLPEPYLSEGKRTHWEEMLERVPPLSFRQMQGHKTIAPAQLWGRIQNVEIPQLYPVFPYGIYGVGKPDLHVARNTWKYDTEAIDHRNYVSWHQDNIFCARLGLTEEAAEITTNKLQDSGRRFPAFWGPGHDWVPDHNWGGSGMIGLQEMLLQTNGDEILLFPAWPAEWNVDFKLHAPDQTVIEGILKEGKIDTLTVTPTSREQDVQIMI